MVTEHQVRERAYYIWEGEGRHCGRADTHWLQAEAELHAPQVGSAAIEAAAAPGRAASRTKTEPKSTAKTAAKMAAKAAKTVAAKTSETSPAKTLKPRAAKAKAAAEAPAAIRVKRAPRTRAETPALH